MRKYLSVLEQCFIHLLLVIIDAIFSEFSASASKSNSLCNALSNSGSSQDTYLGLALLSIKFAALHLQSLEMLFKCPKDNSKSVYVRSDEITKKPLLYFNSHLQAILDNDKENSDIIDYFLSRLQHCSMDLCQGSRRYRPLPQPNQSA